MRVTHYLRLWPFAAAGLPRALFFIPGFGRAVCRWVVRNGVASLNDASLPLDAQRELFRLLGGFVPIAAGVTVQEISTGGVPAEWVSAAGIDEKRVLLYLHGGAYCLGLTRTHQAFAAVLSKACNARVLLPHYRLAPEHPFPAAVDDCTTAYRWLRDQGVPARRIALGGDSAGGGLVLSLLLSLRQESAAHPSSAFCLSPWTDLALAGESYETKRSSDLSLNSKWLRAMAENYVGDSDPKIPLISPVYGDMHGLPPVLIHVGTDEILASDATCVAGSLRDAGVQVEIDMAEGMWHCWHYFHGHLPEADVAVEKVGSFVRGHFGSGVS